MPDNDRDDNARGRLWMPRSRGGLSGTLLVLAGLWGGLIPFVGPMMDWVIGPDDAWNMTEGRFWLSLVPGIATVVGGVILLRSANRAMGGVGAWIAMAGGAWFAVGPTASRIWASDWVGEPLGGPTQAALESLTYFQGLGALIVALSAFALGRMTLRAAKDVVADDTVATTAEKPRTGRFERARAGDDRDVVPAGSRAAPPLDLRPDDDPRNRPML